MTTFIPDAVIWAAAATGLEQSVTGELAPGRVRSIVAQWAGVASYAARRPGDPTPGRAGELAEIFAGSGVDHLQSLAMMPATSADALLEAAGVVLADAVRSDAGLPSLGSAPVPAVVGDVVLERCLAWHDADVRAAAPLLDLFTGHRTEVDQDPPPVDRDLLARLTGWLSDRVAGNVVIERAVIVSGGFSRLMVDLGWTCAGSRSRCIVRIEQCGMFASESRSEVATMRAVAAAGYPVPTVLWEEPDPAVLGEPFFVMAWVDGATRLDSEALDDVLRSLSRLHSLDRGVVDVVAGIDGVAPGASPQDAIEAQLAHWRAVYRRSAPHPVPLLERSFGWLEGHLRPTGPTVVVHGDPGPGNALHDGSGIAAIIDWEFAHAGDAAEDWSYLALIRGRRVMSPEDWKARLLRTVGVDYEAEVWSAWEAYNGVKGSCVNLTALDVFATSPRPEPDHLAIGVAVHLRFLDRLLDLTGARQT